MAQTDERWDDPIPPEMFSPSDETVESILDQANRKPINQSIPRNKMLTSAAVLALVIIGCAVGVRMLDTIWGETVLPRGSGYSSGNAASPADAAPSPAAAQIAAPQEKPIETAPVAGIDETQGLANDGAALPSSAPASSGSGNANGAAEHDLRVLCLDADAIVSGTFDAAGYFSVEEAFKGECPDRLYIANADSFRGWAVVFLIEADENWIFADAPFLFRLENENLSARDASGAPMPAFEAANGKLALDSLREFCSSLGE